MWNTESSSDGHGQLSEYERQRLENIAQMSVEFSDLFEEVSKSAQDLAKATSSSTATNYTNGKRRSQNSQQYHKVKIFSKGQERPHSHPIRRSKRLINEKRKKPEYDERSDSDDENPSKVLRLKFPFFKKNEYAQRDEDYYKELGDADFINSDDELMELDDSSFCSKRKHRVSVNTHQIPVSLITQEMIKNITYSSCGKTYDALNGTTCHQCRQKTLDQKSYCRYKKCRGIRGMFCGFCLGKRYGEDVAEVLLNKKWACPPCRGYCNCSICRRKHGRSPTGQLSQIAQAGGYKSVKHLLETTEGGLPEKDLSDCDSDENDQKGDKKDDISESINNNLNDGEIQNNDINSTAESKTDYLNDEAIKTKQEGSITKTEIKDKSDEKQCLLDVLETTEDGIPEKKLSCIYDSNEDDKMNDEEGIISESINNNNSSDDEIQNYDDFSKEKFKTESINKKDVKTEPNDSLVITETENGTDNDKDNSENIKEESSFVSAETILNRLYQQLFCY